MDHTYRTVQLGDYRFAYTVRPGDYSRNVFKSSISFNYFRETVLSPNQTMVTNRYFVFDFAVIQAMWLIRYLHSSVLVCSFTSLLHCVFHFNSAPLDSSEVLWDVPRRFNCIVRGCVATPVHDVSNTITFTRHDVQ